MKGENIVGMRTAGSGKRRGKRTPGLGSAFKVVVATDGSNQGGAAVATAVEFPWPHGTRVEGVVAREGADLLASPASLSAVLDRGLQDVGLRARRVLRRRWADAEVAVVDGPPADGVLTRARGADVIVVGWRGQSTLSRLILGSVSRAVLRRASCPVLVVKGRPRALSGLVVGVDGSANSRRAVAFVTRLTVPAGGRVTVVRVIEPVRPPSMGLLPSKVRALLAGQIAALHAQRIRAAQRELEAAAGRLERAGWAVRVVVRVGTPASELLSALKQVGADLLVVGARGVGGVERLLLGSVAEAALSWARTSVLVVK